MNDFGIGLIIGIFVGDILGVALMSLLALARDPKPPKREPEQKEPTRMWMVGNLCKFEGDVYEIKFFWEMDGHTYVSLSHCDTGLSISVPIEELEVVDE